MHIKLMENLRWLGHDSFLLEGAPTLYFDPWRLGEDLPPADVVFVSHEHGDHCSPDDVRKVSGPNTVIVASQSAALALQGHVRVMLPGQTLVLGPVAVKAVPAYNTNKFRSPGVPFHPQSALHNGYVVTLGGETIYFAGDTDHIAEMADVKCDIALLPVSGKYVMTAEEAAEAAKVIRPTVAIPMHYGAGVAGTASDAARFGALYEGEVHVFRGG